jgi:hypothetical protein
MLRRTVVQPLIRYLPQTIFLCVWQAIHLNVPPPGEPIYKQLLRRVHWAIIAIIAPELAALNAWLQYRRASELTRQVNHLRGLDQPFSRWPPRVLTLLQRPSNWLGTHVGKVVFALLSFPDWLRMLFHHREEMLATKREQEQGRISRLNNQLDNDTLPWTIDIAFYAISGAVILGDDCENDLTMSDADIGYLAQYDAAALIPLQRAALQNPGKASVLAKMITCTQALWFCSQCIARLSQNMAISLIELNTFAHCISAFFIYDFWWYKPYNAEAHVYIYHPELLQEYLLSNIQGKTWRVADVGGIEVNEYVISERNFDGQASTAVIALDVDSCLDSDLDDTIYHKIQYGATIPGTEFTLLCSNEADGQLPFLKLSRCSLKFWERLWRLRTNTRHKIQLHHKIRISHRPRIRRRAKNLDQAFVDSAFGDGGKTVSLILTSVFLVYGGVHLVAWQYNFQTNAEGTMWRIASIITTSSGLIILLAQILDHSEDSGPGFYLNTSLLEQLKSSLLMGLGIFIWVLVFVEILARSFLVIESFRALPNSPSSVYEIPRWTAYLPHI